ncbi:MAG: class I SAM-dependent methyltransferase [Oscillospiraceae bacterium]|nr:class I SAM-dependent methyltransferase [Oscillospiraceae bacterium]
MSSYGALALWYDSLTGDVPYAQFADLYEAEFARDGGEFRLLLDFCCGTGTLTALMARRGYEMIAADASADMLMQAREKAEGLAVPPLFLCQSAEELDLYGTVDAAYCSLDGMNYLPPEALPELFRRLHLFIRPGGLLIFDIRTPDWLRERDGQVFLDETDDLLCLWRADFDEAENALVYGMDLFSRQGELWRREREEHVEYAHEPEALEALLTQAGFVDLRRRDDGPQGGDGRLFVIARRETGKEL